MSPEGPYHKTRPPSGRHPAVAASAVDLAEATSELEELLGKHMRALQLKLEHSLLASSSAEVTRAKIRASEEEQRARAAESRALQLEGQAARLARKSLWRGLGAIVASVASISSLAVVAMLSRSMRTYVSDDADLVKASTVEVTEQLESRLKADAETRIGELRLELRNELRSELRSELALQFGVLREELAKQRDDPPARRRTKK